MLYKQYREFIENLDTIVLNFYFRKHLRRAVEYAEFRERLTDTFLTRVYTAHTADKQGNVYKALFLASRTVKLGVLVCYAKQSKLTSKTSIATFNKQAQLYEDVYKNALKLLGTPLDEKYTSALLDISYESCKGTPLDVSFRSVLRKLDDRGLKYKMNKDVITVVYNDNVFFVKKNGEDALICRDPFVAPFVQFLEDPFSPLLPISGTVPSESCDAAPLGMVHRRSLINIKDMSSAIGYTRRQILGKINKYVQKTKGGDCPATTFEEIESCLVNERTDTGELKYAAAEANFKREPLMRYIVHLDCKDSEVLHNAKRGMTYALGCLKEVYRSELRNKKYFLIVHEGGPTMHFDYSLYALRESHFNKPAKDVLVPKNLFRKLEFKSYENARKISDLPKFLKKSIAGMFPTSGLTFKDTILSNLDNLKWMSALTKETYFRTAIENVLSSQRNKVYLIWNSKEQRMYLDVLTDDDLQIESIGFDKTHTNKVRYGILLKSGSVILMTLDRNSFDFRFKQSKERENVFSNCSSTPN